MGKNILESSIKQLFTETVNVISAVEFDGKGKITPISYSQIFIRKGNYYY